MTTIRGKGRLPGWPFCSAMSVAYPDKAARLMLAICRPMPVT